MTTKKTWHENDCFWKNYRPIMFPAERFERAGKEIDHVLALVKISPPAAILDLCCGGVGRHSLEFARRNFKVTGVDRTRQYLHEARQLARKEALQINFIRGDMRVFRKANTFDLVVNLFTAFGYFDNPQDDRKVIKNIHASLKKGGQLVMDMLGKEILARNFRERDWYEHNGTKVLEERTITRNWSWLNNRWYLIKGGKTYTTNLTMRVYSAVELEMLLKSCGFKKVRIYGDLAGSLYNHQARRLVVVAAK
jgi:SAM-dependent methyltransferase